MKKFTPIRRTSFMLAAGLVICSVASSKADLVTFNTDFTAVPNVVSGINEGGLGVVGNDNVQYVNGVDELSFLITVDDSAGTGAVFEATLLLSGVLANSNGRVREFNVLGIQFDDTFANQDTLTFTMGSLMQISGPASSASFDGFSRAGLNFFGNNDDSFTVDGQSFMGGTGGTGNNVANFSPLIPSGATFDTTGTSNWRLQDIDSQFTVTISAVPEPSAALFLSMTGILCGVLQWRRRHL